MEAKIKEGEVKDVIKGSLEHFKEVIKNVVLTMAEADMMAVAVLCVIKDLMCVALRHKRKKQNKC